jgi:hypothetical protein
MIFRQFEGLFPMAVSPVHLAAKYCLELKWLLYGSQLFFVPGITQSMAWTLLSPYIKSCPKENPHIVWQNFPKLDILNNPDATPLTKETYPAITHNRSIPLSYPGRKVEFQWELPGKVTGYDGLYRTSTNATGPPKFAAWISQLNTTYTPLEGVDTEKMTACAPPSYSPTPSFHVKMLTSSHPQTRTSLMAASTLTCMTQ